MLLGEDGLERLSAARIAIVGVGGVGAYAAEMLARAGAGHLLLVDADEVGETNINRQLPALHSTVGRNKVDVMRERLLDINPDLDVSVSLTFLAEDNMASVLGTGLDFVVDAIDTLSPKVALIRHCLANGIPLVSSMGSGAKLDATAVRVADISKTFECPLARMIRKRLHAVGIEKGFQAVFSPEVPRKESMVIEETRNKKSQVGTVPYIPAVFGCVCAQVAICRIAGIELNC